MGILKIARLFAGSDEDIFESQEFIYHCCPEGPKLISLILDN